MGGQEAWSSLDLFGSAEMAPASAPAPAFVVEIPGDPVAQGRGKAARWQANDGRSGLTVRDPSKSRNWKAYAADFYRQEIARCGGAAPFFGDSPVSLEILCVFRCPRSQYRKRDPLPRRWRAGERNDADNLAKACMDAANGILWLDDGQVVELFVRKVIGAQGEASRVVVSVSKAGEVPA